MPEVGLDDVLIRIRKTAICGTDVHIFNWDAVGAEARPVADGHRPRIRRDDRGRRRQRARLQAASGQRRGTHRLRPLPQLPRRAAASVRATGRASASTATARSPNTSASRDATSGTRDPAIPMDVLAFFDPLGNATHTALSFDLRRRGRADHRRRADRLHGRGDRAARRRAARRRDRRQSLPPGPRATDGRGRWRSTSRTQRSTDAQKQLGMSEGFDVGMEMSGNPAAFRAMLDNMCHGGRIALLGIQPATARSTGTRSSSAASPSRASTAARCSRPGTR